MIYNVCVCVCVCTRLWKMIPNHHQKLATELLDHHLKPVAESCQGKNESVYPYHCLAYVTECHRSHARLVVWYLSLQDLATRKEQENISITSLTKDSLLNHETCMFLSFSLSFCVAFTFTVSVALMCLIPSKTYPRPYKWQRGNKGLKKPKPVSYVSAWCCLHAEACHRLSG